MFLHVNPSSILPPIIFLLNRQYFIQVDLGQPFSLLWLQPQSKSNGGIMMRKCQYLHNQCEFIDAPPEGFILKNVDDYFRGDLPWCVAHRLIQRQDLLQFLWKGTLGQPLQFSSRSEETLQVTRHHVHASFFSSCAESQEVSDLYVYLIAVQECFLDGYMLLQVGWVKHQKSLKMGDVAVGIEQGIQRSVDGFGDRWHEEHPMWLCLLHPMVTLQLEEAVIPIQS